MTESKDALLQEMQDIKKLLLLLALSAGYQQQHLAKLLEVSDATLSRMLPKGSTKKAS